MRLLELTGGRIRLQHFQTNIPGYAILSHTWGHDGSEITFADLEDDFVPVGTGLKAAGYRKLMFCAEQARRDGLRWFWVDSCCIDQNNLRELSESILSMFKWYQLAAKCYVYLTDVSFDRAGDHYNEAEWLPSFQKSRWFTRGWTLQELLAPRIVEFFSVERQLLGTKRSLERQLHNITQVPTMALRGESLNDFSVDDRMGWAARRTTTKVEDQAYCLQGLFSVFLPPHYGEGDYAFIRLREAIDTYAKCKHIRYRSNSRTEKTLICADQYPKKRKRSTCNAALDSDRRVRTVPLPIAYMDHGRDEDPPHQPSDITSASGTNDLTELLSFAQIDDRFENIKANLARTCKWLLSTLEFKDWLDPTKMEEHHGFFWIRGKPGCGKSTLTKFVFQHLKRSLKDTKTLSFFFNARGAELEKSTLGLYRSLLVQLIKQDLPSQEWWQTTGSDVRMTDESLKWLLRSALQQITQTSVTIVIDALDEGSEDDIRDMIRFFSDVSSEATDDGRCFRVFFSSRHYPYITIQPSTGIVVEDQTGHTKDIETYVQTQLQLKGKAAQRLRAEIQERALGVFMWVVLVVKLLNKSHDRGQGEQALLKELRKIPSDLLELLKNILTRDRENLDTMKLCMQWLLYSKRPLTPVELHHAVLLGTTLDDSQATIVDLPGLDDLDKDTTEIFITTHSKGLAEITKNKKPVVQFIHESVRDFLLKERGLQQIWKGLEVHAEGQSHDALKRCCAAHLTADVATHLDIPSELPQAKSSEARKLITETSKRFPFLEYAFDNVLYHAENSQASGVDQRTFLQSFEDIAPTWLLINNVFEIHQIRRHPTNVDIGYVLADQNHVKLLRVLLQLGRPPNGAQGRYGNYMFATLANGCDETFDYLAGEGSQFYPTSTWLPDNVEALHKFVYEHANRELLRRFLDIYKENKFFDTIGTKYLVKLQRTGWGDISTALHAQLIPTIDVFGAVAKRIFTFAVDHDDYHTCALLIDRGFDINSECSDFQYSWQDSDTFVDKAVREQKDKFLHWLLDRGALVENVSSIRYGSALAAAAAAHSVSLLTASFDRGADVNLRLSGQYGSALAAACALNDQHSMISKISTITNLLDRGADVNLSLPGKYGSALAAACSRDGPQKQLVKFLLEKGANANATLGGDYGSALAALACSASANAEAASIARLLIDHGADVNAKLDGKYGSALIAAAWRVGYSGRTELLEVFLDAGAEINATSDKDYGNALVAAAAGAADWSSYGVTAARFLLDRGADPNAYFETGKFHTALEAASSGIRKAEHSAAQLLRERGALR